jgi:gamma-glutamyltranspeptidase/glutathione hydrolase
VDARGGLVTRNDLSKYTAHWSQPVEVQYGGTRLFTRAGLSPVREALERLPPLRGQGEPARALALVSALGDAAGYSHTTNLAVRDEAGNACVLTTSLGLGSGDFLAGFDLHLNSMLGEVDLLRGPLEPGDRMESMMAPSVALDDDGLVLAIGAAGGTRLRSALVQVVAGILDEGLAPQDAVDRARLHPAGSTVHLEPGFGDDVVEALRQRAEVHMWRERHHFFGGVSVVARTGAAGDPRRSGAARSV